MSKRGAAGGHEAKAGDTPKVVSVVTLDGLSEHSLLALASRLARGLDAPLATAILDSAREREVPVGDVDWFHETAGAGVAASVAGHTVALGNPVFFAELGLSVDSLGEWPERIRRQGQHVLFVAVDGRTAGVMGVADVGLQGHSSTRHGG